MSAEAQAAPPSTLDWEALAVQRLPRAIYDYFAGGAGDESTVRRNVEAFDEITLTPRVLPGSAGVDLATAVPGGTLRAPLLVAPMALQGMCHPDAEVATATAAASLGLGFCRSMFASAPLEQVAAAEPRGVRWAQLYVLRDPGLTRHAVDAAVQQGYGALVVTIDVPRVGQRARDEATGFDRFGQETPAIVRAAWFREYVAALRRTEPAADERTALDRQFPNPHVTWDDVARLAADAPLPVLVKGVLHPDDARQAVAAGASGVVVSNHGGRQLERSVASAHALPGVAEAVGGTVPVYVDSGVRRGAHVAAALALGADAVLVGRPVLWGLAVAGSEGVAQVLGRLVAELEATLAILGCPTLADARRCLPHGHGGAPA